MGPDPLLELGGKQDRGVDAFLSHVGVVFVVTCVWYRLLQEPKDPPTGLVIINSF